MPKTYVIHAASEQIDGCRAYWSNTTGWTGLSDATRFTEDETHQLRLPIATNDDASWALLDVAQALEMPSNPAHASVRLVLDVTYDLNGSDPELLAKHLERMCERAVGGVMLPSGHSASVAEFSMEAKVRPAHPSEEQLTAFMAYRIDQGALDEGDLANRLAAYGLMQPDDFVNEMVERMGLTLDDGHPH